jgi:uncharacterized membrane protein
MTILPIHIAAGLVGIISGAIALYALKGAKVHRKSGMVFVYAMVLMTMSALPMAIAGGIRFSASQAALTLYLVVTALLTTRQRVQEFRWINVAAMLTALAIGLYDLALGVEAMNSPKGILEGVPAAMIFIFAGFALLAALGDLRMMLVPQFERNHRIARHLWRMCLALWVAVASFFLGQPKFFPEPLRSLPVLAIPVLLVLVLSLYWFVRVRFTKWTVARASVLPAKRETAALTSDTFQL